MFWVPELPSKAGHWHSLLLQQSEVATSLGLSFWKGPWSWSLENRTRMVLETLPGPFPFCTSCHWAHCKPVASLSSTPGRREREWPATQASWGLDPGSVPGSALCWGQGLAKSSPPANGHQVPRHLPGWLPHLIWGCSGAELKRLHQQWPVKEVTLLSSPICISSRRLHQTHHLITQLSFEHPHNLEWSLA